MDTDIGKFNITFQSSVTDKFYQTPTGQFTEIANAINHKINFKLEEDNLRILNQDIDWIALSFVQKLSDVEEVKK